MNVAAKPVANWWETTGIVIFGITVPILPMLLAFVSLWVGIEIAKDSKRKLTRRQKVFLNVGLTIVTFLVVTGQLWGGRPLEVGWATVMGFGIGMNGIVIFELFQRMTYNVFSLRLQDPPRDSDPPR